MVVLEPEYANSKFLQACEKGKIEDMNHLIKAGVHLNCLNSQGHGPLHLACKYGQLEAVKLLLSLNCISFLNLFTGLRPRYIR